MTIFRWSLCSMANPYLYYICGYLTRISSGFLEILLYHLLRSTRLYLNQIYYNLKMSMISCTVQWTPTPSLFFVLMSAPFWCRNFTILTLPEKAAMYRTLRPLLHLALILAPFWTTTLTISTPPCFAAMYRGLRP